MEQALNEFGMGAMLRQPDAQLGTSPAGLLADVINMMRVDVKMMGVLHDVDIEVEEMIEDRMASLLETLVRGEPELLEVTNDIAYQRQKVILEALDSLPTQVAAVHGECFTGGKRRSVRGEPQYRIRDLVGGSESLHRMQSLDL